METLTIDIVDPKAKRIIENLQDLNLISIRDNDTVKSFQILLNRLKTKKKGISLREITKEVESVRSKRYGKKN